MNQTEISTADPHPTGRIAPPTLHAKLTPSSEPQGVSMQVEQLFEDIAPRELDGTLVNQRAGGMWDCTGETTVHELDRPPVCDRGPNLSKGDL